MSPPAHGTTQTSERLRRYDAVVAPFMVFLGLNYLVLLSVDLADLPITHDEQWWLRAANGLVYVLFAIDAFIRLALTDNRRNWLRSNALLLVALSLPLILPFDRHLTTPVTVLVRLSTLLWASLRGLMAIQRLSRGQVFYYLILLTTFVVLIGASVVMALEHGHPGTQIRSYGDALWWSSTLITTVNSGADPVSAWGRVVAILMRIYAVGFFSYLVANLASLFAAYFKDHSGHHEG